MTFQVSLTEISVDYMYVGLGSTKKNDVTGFSECSFICTRIGKIYVNLVQVKYIKGFGHIK